jgi:hypothetical protein
VAVDKELQSPLSRSIGISLDGRILLWNAGARRLYGSEAKENRVSDLRSGMSQICQSLYSTDSDDYLTKPFSVVQLRTRVLAALRHKTQQENAAG